MSGLFAIPTICNRTRFALLRDQPFDKEPEMASIRQVNTSGYTEVDMERKTINLHEVTIGDEANRNSNGPSNH